MVINHYQKARVFIYALVERVKTRLRMDILLHMYHVVELVVIMVEEKEEMPPKTHMDQVLHIYVVAEVAAEQHI